jgi:2-polyprenyl-3-methyl-5-hydroxy-6-metoxy-1,4-benzoquinol methylase
MSEKIQTTPLTTNELHDASRVTADGERVTHLWPNDCYYAHLSIYYFALSYAQGKTVLDAGSGAGYGSAYLVENGAHGVVGIDVSQEAVQFSQRYFDFPNLRYQVMSLEDIQGFADHSFDLILSSNVLEHVPDVLKFFNSAWRLLVQNGTMIVAVPPVIDDATKNININNTYHLNIWTPHQWYHVLQMFFTDVQCYRHRFDKPGITLDFNNQPEDTVISEKDFRFEMVSLDQLYEPTITVLFTVRAPRLDTKTGHWERGLTFVDESFTRSPAVAKSIHRQNRLQHTTEILCHEGLGAFIKKASRFLYRRLRRGLPPK